MTPVTLTPAEAGAFMVDHAGLRQPLVAATPAEAVRRLLIERRCIQLDPLDPIGTNADLVALARVDGLVRGDVYRHLLPGHAFEHFAKMRCLLPASAFPHYRDSLTATGWWSFGERLRRLPEGVVEAVLAEVRASGPVTVEQLADHGAVKALDWSGWKGTGKATKMAIEVLWTRCDVVVCGRSGRGGKVYDVPERALPEVAAAAPAGDVGRWVLTERVAAAGLMARADGPHWATLDRIRKGDLPEQMVADGALEEVVVSGSRRRYLAPLGFRDRPRVEDDGRMRILGPLDPLIWDRKLVAHAFGFDYVWEVYKPKAKRRWGWYVCPLLHRGALVGRVEARAVDGELVVDNLWKEDGVDFDDAAFDAAIARHQRCL